MTFLSQHKLIAIVVAIIVASGVWYGLSAPPASPDLITTPAPGATNLAGQDLVATLLTLRAVKLDGTIFNDPSFMALKDFSTEIVPEPVGRVNPFAPLQAGASASDNTTKSAQIFTPRD